MHLQASDEICHKIEFYLRVYFAIYPMHPNNPRVPSYSLSSLEV